MKLHARIYEPGAAADKHIANLDQVLTTTLEGKPGDKPCAASSPTSKPARPTRTP